MSESAIMQFLPCRTPQAWIEQALRHQDILLIDHANCEKKAASTAMNLMYRYVDRSRLLEKMSQLAREELLHFEQVVGLMRQRGVVYRHLGPSRYAAGLHAHVRTHEPARLVDILIVGAFVEARSCERFAALAPHLDEQLGKYYRSLLRSEGRHFEDYLQLAREAVADGPGGAGAGEDIDARIAFFGAREHELISSPDTTFRFHSGLPAAALAGDNAALPATEQSGRAVSAGAD